MSMGYLLTDFIEAHEGRMLTRTWEEPRHDKRLRANLFKVISRTILSLGRVPLPLVGSFTIDDCGFLSLTNRPLTLELHQLENEGSTIDIQRNLTYTITEFYVIDLLHCHRTRSNLQPNAIHDEFDGLYEAGAMTAMQMVSSHRIFKQRLRHGSLALTSTELHHSNILVDKDWHITGLVGLEWACARPIEMQHPPYWLATHSIDNMDVDAYEQPHQEFMITFEEEETRLHSMCQNYDNYKKGRANVMRKGWKNGNIRYSLALASPTGLTSLLYFGRSLRKMTKKNEFIVTKSRYDIPLQIPNSMVIKTSPPHE
ncbi:MAG: hypothetical protein M1837_006701 [Sclerophora amabilis]|nr:MAG: hypothetical protein M1837_006701 [Sclerophora amabilis]